MSHQKYIELLSEFCSLVDATNTADILEHGNLHIDGVAFSLAHEDTLGRDDLIIYCDFGSLPQKDSNRAYLELLHANLMLYGGSLGGTFAINPESGNVLLLAYQRLADATPEGLASHLNILAELAKLWRDGEAVLDRLFAIEPARSGETPERF
ncbi:Tir chaperone protein (CesT) [compost metagenome]